MSILIQDLEMPTSCDMCLALDDYGDYPRCRITEEQRGYNFPIKQKRMDNCPLVHVPPHGRLIDADVVFKRLQKQAMSVWGNGNPRYQIVLEVMDAIRFAPTIIEAESCKEKGE